MTTKFVFDKLHFIEVWVNALRTIGLRWGRLNISFYVDQTM